MFGAWDAVCVDAYLSLSPSFLRHENRKEILVREIVGSELVSGSCFGQNEVDPRSSTFNKQGLGAVSWTPTHAVPHVCGKLRINPQFPDHYGLALRSRHS